MKFNAKHVILVMLPLLLALSGCSKVFIYPSEETATALALLSTTMPTETLVPVEAEQELQPLVSNTPSPTLESIEPGITTETIQITNTVEQTIEEATEENTNTPTPEITNTPLPPILYYTKGGDTIEAICAHFGVEPDQISSPDYQVIPSAQLLNPNKLLIIPDVLSDTTPHENIMPDSEIVYSPSSLGFDITEYVNEANGYLIEYKEWRTDGWYNGGEVINRVAYENSVNPMLLLALLEYQSGWVLGHPENLAEIDYPMGWKEFEDKELYKQLSWAVQQLFIGYYGWRAGSLNELTFPDGEVIRIAPEINAGTVAIQYFFSRLYNLSDWNKVIYASDGFMELYTEMFGNAWDRAQTVEPLYPPDLKQPTLVLPFQEGKEWNYTGGPHAAWGRSGVLAALDFAPPTEETGCIVSEEWVTASSPGLVIHSYNGLVLVDLDGDGHTQTGWVMMYMHVHHENRVPVGTWLDTGDKIGHPSCEGGVSTGTHVHVARKYNGEWIPADGPLPFLLSGWTAHNGDIPYEGTLTNGSRIVNARLYGEYDSVISH